MLKENRIALVTGANRGIGKEVALELAHAGAYVIVGARNEEEGEETRDLILKNGGRAEHFPLDVSKEKSVLALSDLIEGTHGRLDILVNNAGIFIDKGEFVNTTMEELNATLQTNVAGPFRLTQLFLPRMIQNNYGRIVNVSSGMGQLSDMGSGYPAYRISKTAINAITRISAQEAVGKNIKVNSVCPGWVKTDMGGPNASRSIEKGAETIIWAALLPDDGPTGKFFRDKKEIEW
ncbi:MAG: SDR family oxidoreductase [Leptospira sp.]|jgi:NAD(P)-dependent dehydrogenase (short-subunit alcohol dehydrogenase family)|nr:SDR family oxidoreductase [Leptospira sp.]